MIDGVVKLVLEHLTETWRNVVDVRFRVNGRDTRPQMLQVAAPNEVVVLIGFDIKIGDARGMLNFCLPATAIETVGDSFTHTWYRTHREPTMDDRQQFWRTLGHLPVAVAATVETTLLVVVGVSIPRSGFWAFRLAIAQLETYCVMGVSIPRSGFWAFRQISQVELKGKISCFNPFDRDSGPSDPAVRRKKRGRFWFRSLDGILGLQTYRYAVPAKFNVTFQSLDRDSGPSDSCRLPNHLRQARRFNPSIGILGLQTCVRGSAGGLLTPVSIPRSGFWAFGRT